MCVYICTGVGGERNLKQDSVRVGVLIHTNVHTGQGLCFRSWSVQRIRKHSVSGTMYCTWFSVVCRRREWHLR